MFTLPQDPESAWDIWQEEYKQVVSGFDQLHPDAAVQVHAGVGLAVVTCPDPLHYYSIFSHTCGCDYVLTMYAHNRRVGLQSGEVEGRPGAFVGG